MAIDPVAAAVGIANLIFVQPNATATVSVTDLQTLASAVDTGMTAQETAFIAALSTIASKLTTAQFNTAMTYMAMVRAGLI